MFEENQPLGLEICIQIEEEEWDHFSYEKKQHLLACLERSQSGLAQGLLSFVRPELEYEKKKRTIDFEATLQQAGY